MADKQKNADRFLGFADVYDNSRPKCPEFVLSCLTSYLGRIPDTVVDMGCGTGLSTLVWSGHCQRIMGIEPSEDMQAIARAKAAGMPEVQFISAFSDATGLQDEIADIVTCSQSFHWMNPYTTLPEIARILAPGGVFAAYDCDWPPVCGAELELADNRLSDATDVIEAADPSLRDSFQRWSKDGHLERIQKSGLFRFSREMVFHHAEPFTAERYKLLSRSQGGLQGVLKAGIPDIAPYLEALDNAADDFFGGGEREIVFCYRMRIGIK